MNSTSSFFGELFFFKIIYQVSSRTLLQISRHNIPDCDLYECHILDSTWIDNMNQNMFPADPRTKSMRKKIDFE